jgi:hypothetical protein
MVKRASIKIALVFALVEMAALIIARLIIPKRYTDLSIGGALHAVLGQH